MISGCGRNDFALLDRIINRSIGKRNLPQYMKCDIFKKKGDINMEKTVKLEYLYLDLNTCDRCMGTDVILDEVVSVLQPVLELAGYTVTYEKQEMTTVKDAVKYEFVSSPTLRVNGRDICTTVKENACGCCSDISGTAVTCRVFTYEGQDYEVPPRAMLAEEILRVIFGGTLEEKTAETYVLPQNLKDFYRGKMTKNVKCCCGGNSDCC